MLSLVIQYSFEQTLIILGHRKFLHQYKISLQIVDILLHKDSENSLSISIVIFIILV